MIPAQRLLPLLPVLRVLLVTIGLVLLSYGLWTVWPPLGFLGGGVSCISVEMVIADRLSRR